MMSQAVNPAVTYADPYFGSQWHLSGALNINVQPIWAYYKGAGIKVAVMDDGFDYNHTDLSANYSATLDYDFVNNDTNALYNPAQGDAHGTAVAGVIAADDNNAGTVGVAPDATLIGLRVGFGSYGSISQYEAAYANAAANADVLNCSFGYSNAFSDNFHSSWFTTSASRLASLASSGRGGLGTITVFCAGNEKEDGDSSNYHNHQNSIYSIAVGAVNSNGTSSYFSSPGANVLVSAGGAGIITADNSGNDGYVSGNYVTAAGTSFSAPMVSGVVALMLSANNQLGWRDVQDILAVSAVRVGNGINDGTAETYRYNNAGNWNGGGMHFSNQYGYGIIDASAAVKLAETWQFQRTSANMVQQTVTNGTDLSIVDNGATSNTVTMGSNLQVQNVQVAMRILHGHMGDLDITLISPSGTRSLLLDNVLAGYESAKQLNFTFSSQAFRGENSAGNWRLEVVDNRTGSTGIVDTWSLTLTGNSDPSIDQYIYTDEFSTISNETGRRVLDDVDGGRDIVNLSALSSNSTLNLLARTGNIDGISVTVASSAAFEEIIGGYGNDTLIGDNNANTLRGNRGNDVMIGYGGNDTLYGGAGINEMYGEAGNDVIHGGADRDVIGFDNGYGNDTFTDGGGGVDRILFFNLVRAMVTFSQSGMNLLATTNMGDTLTIVNHFSGPSYAIEEVYFSDVGIVAITSITIGSGVSTITGTSGNDTLQGTSGNDTINALAGNDIILAGDGGDVINAGTGNNVIYGERGNDTIFGGSDRDTVGFAAGYGNDTFQDDGGVDRLLFFNLNEAQVTFTRSGNNLVATLGTGDSLTVTDHFATGGARAVEEVYFKDRGVLSISSIAVSSASNIINGTSSNDFLQGTGGSDTINALEGNDVVLGGDGNDTIYGGAGINEMYGERGADIIYGGTGRDVIGYGAGYGHDRFIDSGGTDRLLFYDLNRSQVTFSRSGNDLVATVDSSNSLTVVNHYATGGSGAIEDAYFADTGIVSLSSITVSGASLSAAPASILDMGDPLTDSIMDFVTGRGDEINQPMGQSSPTLASSYADLPTFIGTDPDTAY